MIFPSEDIAVDVTVAGANPSAPVNLVVVVVSSVTGKGTATVPLGALNNGPYTYQQSVPECAGGCRLAGLHVVTGGISGSSFSIRVTLRGLRSTSPDREALAPAALAEATRWRATNATVVGGARRSAGRHRRPQRRPRRLAAAGRRAVPAAGHHHGRARAGQPRSPGWTAGRSR